MEEEMDFESASEDTDKAVKIGMNGAGIGKRRFSCGPGKVNEIVSDDESSGSEAEESENEETEEEHSDDDIEKLVQNSLIMGRTRQRLDFCIENILANIEDYDDETEIDFDKYESSDDSESDESLTPSERKMRKKKLKINDYHQTAAAGELKTADKLTAEFHKTSTETGFNIPRTSTPIISDKPILERKKKAPVVARISPFLSKRVMDLKAKTTISQPLRQKSNLLPSPLARADLAPSKKENFMSIAQFLKQKTNPLLKRRRILFKLRDTFPRPEPPTKLSLPVNANSDHGYRHSGAPKYSDTFL